MVVGLCDQLVRRGSVVDSWWVSVCTVRDGVSVCGQLVRCGVSVCSVDVMGPVCDEVGEGQCALY